MHRKSKCYLLIVFIILVILPKNHNKEWNLGYYYIKQPNSKQQQQSFIVKWAKDLKLIKCFHFLLDWSQKKQQSSFNSANNHNGWCA